MTDVSLNDIYALLERVAVKVGVDVSPVTTTTTTAPLPGDRIRFPTGPIKSRLPWGPHPSGITWEKIARWEPLFTDAAKEFNAPFSPLLLACFAVIETGGEHYSTGRTVGTPEQVVRGHSDNRSIGLLQIRADLHDPMQDWDSLEPEGNIRLGTKLFADWMQTGLSWEQVLERHWHPGTDSHSLVTREAYIAAVRALIAEVKGETVTTAAPGSGFTAHTIPGLSKPLLLPVGLPVRTRLTPLGVTGRKGFILQAPFQVTRHTTNNPNPGTDAWQHAGWQANGAPGNPGIAVHAYVDDKEVVIAMPFNEQGVHSGDWRNQQSIATELTRHEGINRAEAEANAIALDAGILHAIGGNVANNLWPHTNGGHCPQLSIPWKDYERRTDLALQALKVTR